MDRNDPRFPYVFQLIAFVLLAGLPAGARETAAEAKNGQGTVTPVARPGGSAASTHAESSSGVSERALVKNIWVDQKQIWRAPLHGSSYRPGFILPFAAATAALIATDKQVGRELTEGPPRAGFNAGRDISYLGSAEAVIGFSCAYYAFGRLAHREKARQTGLLSLEALADSGIVVGILKATSQRERPAGPNGAPIDAARGRFWAGGADFPSGHAISVWTLASVFSESYADKPTVKYTAYGMAGLVSVSRLAARQHFPSDVVVGGVLGYLIGHYVIRAHRR